MVGFGKKLAERQIPAWEAYYINYKMMKRKVKHYSEQLQDGDKEVRTRILKEFSDLLDHQVEKMVLFLLIKQGQLALELSKLADEREADAEREGGVESERGERLRDAYHSVGEDLLSLLRFVDLNATGLRKILKKFDKNVGYRLSDEYVATRSNHPFSQLQHIFRHVGIGSMVATISRNLAELENRGKPVTSIYEQRSKSGFQDPIIESIRKAEDRLTNTAGVLRFLGQQFVSGSIDVPDEEEDLEEKNYHFISLVLNLVNTYLYMVNTYIIVPTADKYATSLGAAPTLCGLIIGSMAIAQLLSSVYLSAWSNTSYFGPLVFSSVLLSLGNVLYAVAYSFNSVTMLLLGRLLCGLGSARAVNRRYISDCVPSQSRLQASAAFVSASALGMASGPALAALMEFQYSVMGLTFSANTLPGWTMGLAWVLYLIWVLVAFKEPVHSPLIAHDESPAPAAAAGMTRTTLRTIVMVKVEGGEKYDVTSWNPFLSVKSLTASDMEVEEEEVSNSTDKGHSKRAVTSFREAYNLLTFPVKVQLYIYFMLKFAMEILLSESSVVTQYYFGWGTRAVALFLALLGLTVLPVNWVVGSYASNIFQDRQLLIGAELLTCAGLVLSFDYKIFPYTPTQYVIGALVLFVSSEVLEGVNLSLLSQVMSSKLSRGTYNGGLLSTEAGTLARVVADCAITVAGYMGEGQLLNATLGPTLLIGILGVLGTLYTYESMF